MRVALVVDAFFPHMDGVTAVVDNYARILTQRGDEVIVFTPAVRNYTDNFPYKVCRGCSVDLLTDISIPVPWLTDKVRRTFDEFDPDVVHLHSPFFMSRYITKLAHRRGIPVVTTLHTKFYDDFLTYTHSKLIARWGTNYVIRHYNKCESVWACSKCTAQTLRSYGYKGDITAMPNAPDVGAVYPDDQTRAKLTAAADEAYGTPAPGLRMLFVGHMLWQKNHRLILDTCAELKKRGVQFTLTAAGRGEHENEIHRYAEKLQLNDCVHYLGKVEDKKLLQGLYLRSDVMFFPSIYDNAPVVVQEASLNHLPSILMRDTNAAEGVIDGENGYLCGTDAAGCADIIERMALDIPALHKAGDEAARTLVNNWYDILTNARCEYEKIIAAGVKKK